MRILTAADVREIKAARDAAARDRAAADPDRDGRKIRDLSNQIFVAERTLRGAYPLRPVGA